MKEFFSFMMGAMFGAGVMLGASELSKNKEVIKKKVNNLIDFTLTKHRPKRLLQCFQP